MLQKIIKFVLIGFVTFTIHAYAAQPAQRIISLAPNTTELLFATGAGKKIVGVSAYSDYPAVAKTLPIVADYTGLNIEKIVALKPNLIVGWQGGNPEQQIQILRSLHLPVYMVSIHSMPEIADTIKKLGQLAGTEKIANNAANQFLSQYILLLKKYNQQPNKTVFYEVSANPLITLNKSNLVNQIIVACGGENIFANTLGAAPQVSMAALIKLQPQVIIIGAKSTDKIQQPPLWKKLNAVKANKVFTIDPDWLNRPGPRSILAMQAICNAIRN